VLREIWSRPLSSTSHQIQIRDVYKCTCTNPIQVIRVIRVC
jgi:hypothetical protein